MIISSGTVLNHLLPVNFPEDFTEEEVHYYAKLPAVGILSGEHSGRDGEQISLQVLVNGVMVVVAQIPYIGEDQALLAELLQKGADFLNTNPIKPFVVHE